MNLKPAIRHNSKVYAGAHDDSHETLMERHDLAEGEHGFIAADRPKLFMDRNQSVAWLKKNEPAIYLKLKGRIPAEGLHSHIYAQAKGIVQRITKEAREKPEDAVKVDLSQKTAIVYDRGGLYLYCAEKLAQKYGKVMYYLADADAYPTSQKATIGEGIEGVERIHDFWKHLDEADIAYFWDCYDGELQHWLRSKDYTVFGSGRGEQIEIDKILFLETLDKLGLPKAETYVAKGMKDLCDYLKKHDGQTLFLKNLHRGDFESRKFTSMAQSRPFLDDLKKRLGSASDTIEVLVQHKIESESEVGYDGYCVDGQFTDNCIVGYEIKDRGFVAKVFKETPEIVQGINDAFADTLKELGGRGNYSTEIRITKDGKPYYIDPTQRVPSPPGELMCEIYENWAEATYQVAKGILPVLKPKAAYGAEVIMTSSWYDEHEIHVRFPEKYKEHVKLKNHTVRDGEYYCVPNGNGFFFGAIVAYADTLEAAIEKVKEVAATVEADEFHFDDSVFAEAQSAIEAGEKFGIKY